jgi:hypothetical protein
MRFAWYFTRYCNGTPTQRDPITPQTYALPLRPAPLHKGFQLRQIVSRVKRLESLFARVNR